MFNVILALAAFAAAIVCAPFAAAQSGTPDFDIADFGTRLPAQCGPFMDALGKGPTGTEIAVIFQCGEETDNLRSDQRLHLWEDLKFEPLGPRDPQGLEAMLPGYVRGTPVFAFEGTATRIICAPVTAVLQNAGRNCDEFPVTGTGICFYSSSSAWRCEYDGRNAADPSYGVAPR